MGKHTDDQSPEDSLRIRLKRRFFLGGMAGSVAALSLPGLTGCKQTEKPYWSSDNYPSQLLPGVEEAVIIGSGFGGAVTACRLGKKWPGQVTILERGKRYGRNEFPRSLNDFKQAFWKLKNDDVPRIFPLGNTESRGVFDLRSYNHMDTLVAAGYGGGSLLYSAAIIPPANPFFDNNWPQSIKNAKLQPYYSIFRNVVAAAPVPRGPEPERKLSDRYAISEAIANADGVKVKTLEVGVFFGNDPANPTPMGQQEMNKHGAMQTSCTYCAECIVGCNLGAKSSLDYNYLHAAENKYSVTVKTEHAVDRIMALDADGKESTSANGEHGFHVYAVDLPNQRTVIIKTKRVILSAGTYGSTDILLRNKNIYKSLPNISNQIGKRYSGNGDFITFNLFPKMDTGAGKGPTLLQYIDFNSVDSASRQGFIGQHMSLPVHLIGNVMSATNPVPDVREFFQTLIDATSNKILMQVNVGLDGSDGEMSLDKDKQGLRLDWNNDKSMTLYQRIIDAMNRAKQTLSSKLAFVLPTWIRPLRRNLTVHPLGGCSLADSPNLGVVSAKRGEMGKVFNYENLFVADGSIIPSALGANPAVTISALAEMIAEDITQIQATTVL